MSFSWLGKEFESTTLLLEACRGITCIWLIVKAIIAILAFVPIVVSIDGVSMRSYNFHSKHGIDEDLRKGRRLCKQEQPSEGGVHVSHGYKCLLLLVGRVKSKRVQAIFG